ncbi:hypothetical protein Tco_0179659 [Tanacetum coccineum]
MSPAFLLRLGSSGILFRKIQAIVITKARTLSGSVTSCSEIDEQHLTSWVITDFTIVITQPLITSDVASYLNPSDQDCVVNFMISEHYAPPNPSMKVQDAIKSSLSSAGRKGRQSGVGKGSLRQFVQFLSSIHIGKKDKNLHFFLRNRMGVPSVAWQWKSSPGVTSVLTMGIPPFQGLDFRKSGRCFHENLPRPSDTIREWYPSPFLVVSRAAVQPVKHLRQSWLSWGTGDEVVVVGFCEGGVVEMVGEVVVKA